MGSDIREEEFLKSTYSCSAWTDVLDLISKFRGIGATQVVLSSGANHELIRTYAKEILPYFKH